ncbi:hypothetical protein [Tunicatimonas pelagia]|uniref:hypothetical protein n=1 Tax=Tunicatimonas pelagia TaxID=931531 RepID=UPI00266584D2|nr:hypothetical protein [Tunicatimonas pelagia]WKN44967.1 hypothetical protein P0M28_08320 [Tunicatimonas pelagia]
MNQELRKVSLRSQAVFLSEKELVIEDSALLNETTAVLVANAAKLGFGFSEELLRALNKVSPSTKLDVLEVLKETVGVKKNWVPLVKGWDTPTGESVIDHIITFVANALGSKKGARLSCGHLIPNGTFPLERYNGCPFCGTPFKLGEIETYGQGGKLKVLSCWKEADVEKLFTDLLQSKTPIDATQVDSLKVLLKYFPVPKKAQIGMKETLMLVVDSLIDQDRSTECSTSFSSPHDILRYLWFKHTGFLQVVEPKTIVNRIARNHQHRYQPANESIVAKIQSETDLKLKYNRKECRRVAQWLNDLSMDAEKAAEIMHPKRSMWVRFIRALRLAEYSKRKGFENLAQLMDTFYNEAYPVWQGRVNHYRLKADADNTFTLLKQRPGLFARLLFSNMLWFGSEVTLLHFREVLDQLPARLLLTLNMYASNYFEKDSMRSVQPLGSTRKRIASHPLLKLYNDQSLQEMKYSIENLCLEAMQSRWAASCFAKAENQNEVGRPSAIFIDPQLFNIPLSIGDRSETVQDLPSALMGTCFPVQGNKVRLFMQWGEGLKAQHLDMDLSCSVGYSDNTTDYCSYMQLVIPGCKHSGDIRHIPHQVGTAEYIELDVQELADRGARYVSFTCNAYSTGGLSPNLVVGWMGSQFPMKISEKTGVAYDPSCVQHQVRITRGITKGLVFGVLDVKKREVIWLEMPFEGQVVNNLDSKGVKALLAKLDSKLSVGNLLVLKAEAQNLTVVDTADLADEVYNAQWAMNTAAVSQLLLD